MDSVPDLKTSTDTSSDLQIEEEWQGGFFGKWVFGKIKYWSLHGCGVTICTGNPLGFFLPRNPVVALRHVYCNVTPVTGRDSDVLTNCLMTKWSMGGVSLTWIIYIYMYIYIYIYIYIYTYMYIFIYRYIDIYIWSGELQSIGSSRSSVSSLRQRGSNDYVFACILTCDHDSQFSLSSTSGT